MQSTVGNRQEDAIGTKRCGECGLFCSCGALWPTGMCLPNGDRLIEADNAACVCWEKDWRGVDQSDGEREKCISAIVHACISGEAKNERAEGDHGEGTQGPSDPAGAQDVRKTVFPRTAGVLPRARFRQPQFF
jgi:hypothetical protein